jgi:hypothetical protein
VLEYGRYEENIDPIEIAGYVQPGIFIPGRLHCDSTKRHPRAPSEQHADRLIHSNTLTLYNLPATHTCAHSAQDANGYSRQNGCKDESYPGNTTPGQPEDTHPSALPQ